MAIQSNGVSMSRDTSRMPLRQYVTTHVWDKINRRTCWHCDAWLYQDGCDHLYFIVETRRGGWDLLTRLVINVLPNGTATGTSLDISRPFAPDGIQRHINSPWAYRAGVAGLLEAIHWRDIQPQLRQPREGFTPPYSIVLHYVWSDPRVSEPCEGMTNLYEATGRAARDNARRTRPLKAPVSAPEFRRVVLPHWSSDDRAKLRTLDKLLIGKTDHD